MAAYEVLLLNTAIPQIQAAQSGDTYVVPRDIAFSAALTLSAGTANGVPYLNGSKVLTTGSALTFDGTNLSAGSSSQNLGTSSARWGTVYATAFSDGPDQLVGSSGTAVRIGYGASWTAQSFAIGGTEAMRLTSTGLGIGTSSPAVKLQVNGSGQILRVTDGTTGASIYSGSGLFGFNNQTGEDGMFGSTSSHYLYFATNGVENMRLDSSGNLGLGVTPSAWGGNYKGFQVAATGVLASNGSNGTVIGHNSYYDGTNDKYLTSGAASRVFQFNGGIRFDLAPSGFGYGTAATSLTSTQNGNSYTIVTAGTTDFTLIGAANNNVGTTFTKSGGTGAGTGTVSQNISFTQAMTLLANGNLGVGETSPGTRLHASIASATAYTTSSTGNVLTVSNTTASGYAGIAFNTEPSTGNAGLAAINSFAPASGDSVLAFSTRGSATLAERMRLDSSGNLGLGVTPSAWGGGYKGFQVTSTGALASNGSNATGVGHNYFFDGTNNRYLTTGSANLYLMFNTEHRWYNAPSGTAGDPISFTQAMTLDASGNLKLGGTADRATTAGTNHLDIFNGTAPVGTLTNGISIYSSSGEAYVMDAAGNATLFSPHDTETNEWIFKSKHTPTGKVLKIDVERLLKFVNDHFGLDAVHEFVEK